MRAGEAPPLQIRRRCPGCRAPVDHAEAARIVVCGYCGLALALPSSGEMMHYALPPRFAPEAVIPEAKRALRQAGLRMRELQVPWLLYAPFYRLRARALQSWKNLPTCLAGEQTSSGDAGGDAANARHWDASEEIQYRIGIWDQTMDATPELNLGDRHQGVRAQVLNVIPAEDLLREGGQAPAPGRLRATLPPEDARRRLTEMMAAASARPPGTAREEFVHAPFREFQLLLAPYIVVPYRGVDGMAAVAVDAVTGAVRSLLNSQAFRRLETLLEARPGDCPAWRVASVPLRPIALRCPECSGPLPGDPRTAVATCGICLRSWKLGPALQPVPSVGLLPPASKRRGPRPRIHLPFYRLHAPRRWHTDWLYIPAFHGRHERGLWRFAFALSRRSVRFETAEPPEPSAPVEIYPEEVNNLLPFANAVLQLGTEDQAGRSEPELVWLGYGTMGRDLIEPGSGLALRAGAFRPWEPPRTLPAGATG